MLGILVALALGAQAGSVEQPGKIIIFRGGSVYGAAMGCPVRWQGKEIVELGRNKYAEWGVTAGRYVLTNKRSSIEVSVAPGETRYVRCRIGEGFFSGGAELQITDEAEYVRHSAEYERKLID